MMVSRAELNKRMANFRREIKAHKLALTPQKTEIFKILASATDHPDVKGIYTVLKDKFPTISLATIYKNLKKFSKLGLIIEIPLPNGATHYDARIDIHGHIVNTSLGRIYDSNIPLKIQPKQTIMGRPIKSVHLTYFI